MSGCRSPASPFVGSVSNPRPGFVPELRLQAGTVHARIPQDEGTSPTAFGAERRADPFLDNRPQRKPVTGSVPLGFQRQIIRQLDGGLHGPTLSVKSSTLVAGWRHGCILDENPVLAGAPPLHQGRHRLPPAAGTLVADWLAGLRADAGGEPDPGGAESPCCISNPLAVSEVLGAPAAGSLGGLLESLYDHPGGRPSWRS